MSRSDAPRGNDARVRRATTDRIAAAMTSRRVAAHSGGTASFPIRIARNVDPQIAQDPRKAAYGAQSVRAASTATAFVVMKRPTIERAGHNPQSAALQSRHVLAPRVAVPSPALAGANRGAGQIAFGHSHFAFGGP